MAQIEIENRIAKVVATVLKVEPAKLSAETDLIEDLKADSLDALEIAIGLQDTFGIELKEHEFTQFRKFGQIVKAVMEARSVLAAGGSCAAAAAD
jgi:acyl carrier protein